MGQKPAELTPDASPWHRWGAELRRCRVARGLSLEDLGAEIPTSRSHLSKLERGLRIPSRQVAAACDRVLNLAGSLMRAWEQASTVAGHQSSTNIRRVHVSNSAGDVSNLATELVAPEMGQGSSDDEGICVPCRLRDGRVTFVTVPRRVFLRGGVGLSAAAALGLPALPAAPTVARLGRRASMSGPTPVERLRQLRRLLIDNDNMLGPRQIVATVHEQIGVIQTLRHDRDGSDRRDLLELQTQFAEFASWLHQDSGEFAAAQFWLDRALQWSHTLSDRDLTSYVMARKSQLAAEMCDPVEVVDLAEAARLMAPPGSRLAAVGLTYEALGHALRGDARAASLAFDRAHSAAAEAQDDPGPWGVWLDTSYVEVYRAQGLEMLGQHDQAATAFAVAIRQLPAGYHRDRGVYLARQAVAHAGAGAPEQAAVAGLQALAVASDTGSRRIMNDLVRLDAVLQPWKSSPDVSDFRAGLDDVILHEA